MGFTFLILLFPLYLLTSSSLNYGYEIYSEMELDYAIDPDEDSSRISCTCDNRTKTEVVPPKDMDEFFRMMQIQRNCEEGAEICDLLTSCPNCTAEMVRCTPSFRKSDEFSCTKSRMIIKEEENLAMVKESESTLNRKRRQGQPCPVPKLRTGSIYCAYHGIYVNCTEKCHFGQTLPEGIDRHITCMYSKGIWNPIAFMECRPFVDCTITLHSEGRVTFVARSLAESEPPIAFVSCAEYEDKPATDPEKFVCRVAGAWARKLPHCASPGSGFTLVPPPKGARLHPLPKNYKEP